MRTTRFFFFSLPDFIFLSSFSLPLGARGSWMILAALFKGQLGPLRSFRSPNVTTNTSIRPLSLTEPPRTTMVCWNASTRLHAIKGLIHTPQHSLSNAAIYCTLVPFEDCTAQEFLSEKTAWSSVSPSPPKTHRRMPRFAFLWVKNNTEASADISVPMSCLNDQPAPQPKHARSLSLQKIPWWRQRGLLWICSCVELSPCSDTPQILGLWPFF